MATRILVTGGAGYLGSVMLERLLQQGYHVTVVDSLLFNQKSLFHYAHHPHFDFVLGDVRDSALMKRLISKADAIIPLAALVGATICDRNPWSAREVNLEAILEINRLRSPDQAVVYPNTNSGYGTKKSESFCTEETELEPISLYGQTKVQAEAALLKSENVVTLRLATVFGMSSRMRLDLLVNDFVYCAYKQSALVLFEKDFKRNYVHIRDVADAFVHSLENMGKMKGRAYNLGLDSANLSKHELALKIKEHLPNLSIQFDEIGNDPDKRNYVVSSDRLRQAGFEARRSLDDGITELLKGYKMMGRGDYGNV
jgi:nucleoside-diphosphate-sugar epimerase